LPRIFDTASNAPFGCLSANCNTIKALERRGFISPGKGLDPLTIAWRLTKKQS